MFKRFKLVALAAVAATMVGCGAVMAQQGADVTNELLGFRVMDADAMANGMPVDGPLHGPIARHLGLTGAQKQQIAAILAKHRPAIATQAHREKLEALKTLLTADNVDRAAVKAWADARHAEFEAHLADHLAVAGELRAVLTDAQRAKAVALLAQEPPPFQPHFAGLRAKLREHLLADLKLTDAQRTALDALHAKLSALHDPAQTRAMHQAIASFIQTGDQQALGDAIRTRIDGRVPVDDMIAFAASLDKAQRTSLLGKLEAIVRFHQATHAFLPGK